MQTNNSIRILLVCLSVSAAAGHISAQSVEFSNARSMGMARASMVSARGLDAIGLNPANLGLADRSTVSATMFPMGLHVGTNFISWEKYKEYFSGVETDSGRIGKYLSDTDKEDILNNIPGGNAKLIGGATITLFALTYIDGPVGGFAFTVNERMGASATIPNDYLRLLFYGNPVGSKYEFSGTGGSVQWMREYAVHYGRSVPVIPGLTSLSAGISLKLLHGFVFGGIDDFSGMILTDSTSALTANLRYRSRRALIDAVSDTAKGVVEFFPAPAGTGFGMDIGVAARIGKTFSAGVSVTDIGGITWTRNAREFHTDANVTITDPTSQAERDSITDAFKTTEYSVESFKTELPTVLRIGVAVDVQLLPMMKAMPGRMVVELDYIQGLNSSVGNTTSPRFALGVDYHILPWLPIRTGLALGGNERVHWGLGGGVNFDNFDFEVGTEDIIAILAPSLMSTASLAFGARLRF